MNVVEQDFNTSESLIQQLPKDDVVYHSHGTKHGFAPKDNAFRTVTMYVKSEFDSKAINNLTNIIKMQAGVVSVRPVEEQSGLLQVVIDTEHTRGSHLLNSLEKLNFPRSCMALIYFKANGHPEFDERILQIASSIKGICAVERAPNKAHIIIAHFDIQQVKSNDIAKELQIMGYKALLFGC